MITRVMNVIIFYGIFGILQPVKLQDILIYDFNITTDDELYQIFEKTAEGNFNCTSSQEYTFIVNRDLEKCNADGLLRDLKQRYANDTENNDQVQPKYVFEALKTNPITVEPSGGGNQKKKIGIIIAAVVVGGTVIGIAGYFGARYIKTELQSGKYRLPDP